MFNISRIAVDYNGPFPELCARLMETAGFTPVPAGEHWPAGMPLVCGLDRSSAARFNPSTGTPGPFIAVVTVLDLETSEVVEAAGSAHAYCIVEDAPPVLRATVLAAVKRWDIEKRMHESESRFRFIAENVGDVIWTWNIKDNRFGYVSPSISRLRGLSVGEAMAEKLEESLTAAAAAKARAQMAERMEQYMASGKLVPLTDLYEQRHKDGSLRTVEITTTVLLDAQGQPEEVLGVSRDATDRVVADKVLKEALRERDILLSELGHRIKNTLSLTSSLLSLAKSKVHDAADGELFEESQSRVHAMALLYERLLRSTAQGSIDFKAYLTELCGGLMQAYTPRGASGDSALDGAAIELDLDEVTIDSSRAVSLGLAVNEALTNSIKYAARPDAVLRIRVQARLDDERLCLSISDNGPGLPAGFSIDRSEGLGFQLIKALALQLKGSLSLRNLTPKTEGAAGLLLELCIPR
jgi:PAS domain S-box-containing protein